MGFRSNKKKQKLTKAGYNYTEVQKMVNKLVKISKKLLLKWGMKDKINGYNYRFKKQSTFP